MGKTVEQKIQEPVTDEAPPSIRVYHVGHCDSLGTILDHERKIYQVIGGLKPEARKKAYQHIGLEGISFSPPSILDGSYLDVRAESPETALALALKKQDIIREYLSVEINPDEPVDLCSGYMLLKQEEIGTIKLISTALKEILLSEVQGFVRLFGPNEK